MATQKQIAIREGERKSKRKKERKSVLITVIYDKCLDPFLNLSFFMKLAKNKISAIGNILYFSEFQFSIF